MLVEDRVAEECDWLEPRSNDSGNWRSNEAQAVPRADAVDEDVVTTRGHENGHNTYDSGGQQNPNRLQVLSIKNEVRELVQQICVQD